MKRLFGLKDLLKEQIRDLYDAEVHYGNMLTSLILTATSTDLEERLRQIAIQTQENAVQLAHICNLLGVPPEGVSCKAMDGLVREAKETTQDWGDTATIDAALIANAQRIVHYEIAGFGTAREFAQCTEEKETANILSKILDQAFDNDKELSRIAKGNWFSAGVNHESSMASKLTEQIE